jgi:hypothetical protein
MESKERKLCNNNYQGLRPKRIEFGWMDHHQMEKRKKEHKKIILLGFITCKSFNYKSLRTKLLKEGTMI